MTPAENLADARARFAALRDRCAPELAEAVHVRQALELDSIKTARAAHDAALDAPLEGEPELPQLQADEGFELSIVLELAETIDAAIKQAVTDLIAAKSAPPKAAKVKGPKG